jgi:hypothetical protein
VAAGDVDHLHPSAGKAIPTVAAESGTNGRPQIPAEACQATDLAAYLRRGEGATGHYAWLVQIRNVGAARCVLSGYPVKVTISQPGRPPVIAKRGGVFAQSLPISRPMVRGGTTTLVIQTDTSCSARPTGGPAGPFYRDVSVELGDGVLRAATRGGRGLDMGCGAFVTRFGRWE